MKILVIGSGAREHTLARQLLQSQQVEQVYCLPGNPGMLADAIQTVDLQLTDFTQMIAFAKAHEITYTIVGPEQPLVAGIVDAFQAAGLAIFGPSKQAAALEGSKRFAKEVMAAANVPTARYQAFTSETAVDQALQGWSMPCVIKVDGSAAGKGVVVAPTLAVAQAAVHQFFKQGISTLLLEDYLVGEEFSLMALVADNRVYPLPAAQDHKRAFDHDAGPNTGGMGAYCPVPQIPNSLVETAVTTILDPVVKTMAAQNIPFTGVLYAGLIATSSGPKVIEFNVRFGDPETQVVLPRLTSDLATVFWQLLNHQQPRLTWRSTGVTLGIVVAAKGYPTQPTGPFKLANQAAFKLARSQFSFAGVAEKQGELVSTGGRLYTATTTAATVVQARQQVEIDLQHHAQAETFYRHDIGYRAE